MFVILDVYLASKTELPDLPDTDYCIASSVCLKRDNSFHLNCEEIKVFVNIDNLIHAAT